MNLREDTNPDYENDSHDQAGLFFTDHGYLRAWRWRFWSATVISLWITMNAWIIWTKALMQDLALPGFSGPNIRPGRPTPELYENVYNSFEWFIISYPVLIISIFAIYISFNMMFAFFITERHYKTLHLQLIALLIALASLLIHTLVLYKVNPNISEWFSAQLVTLT